MASDAHRVEVNVPTYESSMPRIGGALRLSATLAILIGCGVPLLLGVTNAPLAQAMANWNTERIVAYIILSALFMVLVRMYESEAGPLARWLCANLWAFLLTGGLIGLALQTISGDPFLQPIIFTVLIVHAAMRYSAARTAVVGALYLGLMVLGLWMSGQTVPEALLLPLAGYGAAMVFMYAMTRMFVEQAVARQHADRLAIDLAQQRDYMARLVAVTASLTRNLDLMPALEHVAAQGRVLARAGQARVWLIDLQATDTQETPLRLATAVPPQVTRPVLTDSEQHALLSLDTNMSATRLILPLVFNESRIGVLELTNPLEQQFAGVDMRLLQPFADAAAVAIENARLYEQARLSATLTERNRLARELHDTIAQGLTATTMQLEAAQKSLDRDTERTRARITRAHELARQTLADVRRSVWTLASPLINGEALTEALEELATGFATRIGAPISYQHTGDTPTIDHAVATQALRIVQEALHNIEKHAQATEVTLTSEWIGDALRISVRDNGIGFDPSTIPSDGLPDGNGFGLANLQTRAQLAGGALHIDSAPGAGTTVTLTIQ